MPLNVPLEVPLLACPLPRALERPKHPYPANSKGNTKERFKGCLRDLLNVRP